MKTYKFYLVLLVASSSLAFAQQKKVAPKASTAPGLNGTWVISKIENIYSKSGKSFGETLFGGLCRGNSNSVFNNGNLKTTYYQLDDKENCIVSGKVDQTYVLSGSQLTIKDKAAGGAPLEAKVTKLDAHNLVIESNYGSDEDGDGINEKTVVYMNK